MEDLEPGNYTLREEDVDGWIPTTETEVEVMLGEGDEKTVAFGNIPEEEEIEVPPEPPETPGIEPDPEDPVDEVVEDPKDPDVPPTWEVPPYIFYAAGALVVSGGILLGRGRKRSRSRGRR